MKTLKFYLFSALLILFPLQFAAASPVVDIRPNGSTVAETGDQLSFDVYLNGDDVAHDIMLYAFGLYLDPAELSFSSWSYAEPTNFTEHVAYESRTTYSKEPVWGSFNANDPTFAVYTLGADEELRLGTLTADVLNPVNDGEWDVTIEYDTVIQGDSFFFMDLGPQVLTQIGGSDVSSVPVPAAVWLLGPGLIGLAGLRRRNN